MAWSLDEQLEKITHDMKRIKAFLHRHAALIMWLTSVFH